MQNLTANDKAETIIVHTIENEKVEAVNLDNFKLMEVLGSGAHAKVYLAQKQDEDDKLYAIKVIRKDTILEEDLLEGIIKEREVLSTLDHPFIVHMRYGFQTPERLFFVMDHIKGGELWTYAQEQTRIPEAEVKLYIANIALGIGALHKKNIIHRDIKLPNILIDEDGYLVLSDFGVAVQLPQDDDDTSK